MTPLRDRCVVAILVLLALLAAAFPATADTPVPQPAAPAVTTFGVAPADNVKVDGRAALFYSASPGAQLTDHVAFVNSGTAPVELEVYPSGAIPSSTGEFSLATVAERGLAVGSWLSLTNQGQTLTVPARTKNAPGISIVALALKVPANAAPGDHAGGIVASLASAAVSKSGQHFQLLQRVAVRVYVRVSGPLHPALAVEHLKATYQGSASPAATGRTTLTFDVHNTGNVKLGGLVEAAISSLLGTEERASLPKLPLLLPGAVVPLTVTIPGSYAAIWLTAKVTVSPVTAPGDADPLLAAASASTGFLAMPWTLVALLGGLLSLAGWVVFRRRRQPTPRRALGQTAPADNAKHASPHQKTRSSRRFAS